MTPSRRSFSGRRFNGVWFEYHEGFSGVGVWKDTHGDALREKARLKALGYKVRVVRGTYTDEYHVYKLANPNGEGRRFHGGLWFDFHSEHFYEVDACRTVSKLVDNYAVEMVKNSLGYFVYTRKRKLAG